jgi:hypothetical protein
MLSDIYKIRIIKHMQFHLSLYTLIHKLHSMDTVYLLHKFTELNQNFD